MNEDLKAVYRRTLVRRLAEDALDALDEFLAERPGFVGSIMDSLEVSQDVFREVCVLVQVQAGNDVDSPDDAEAFPLGTPKAEIRRWLLAFERRVNDENQEDDEYAGRADKSEIVNAK